MSDTAILVAGGVAAFLWIAAFIRRDYRNIKRAHKFGPWDA